MLLMPILSTVTGLSRSFSLSLLCVITAAPMALDLFSAATSQKTMPEGTFRVSGSISSDENSTASPAAAVIVKLPKLSVRVFAPVFLCNTCTPSSGWLLFLSLTLPFIVCALRAMVLMQKMANSMFLIIGFLGEKLSIAGFQMYSILRSL